MEKELEIIKENLEATLEGFKDAYETEGYELKNESYYVKIALKQVNLLLLHNVSNSFCNLYKKKCMGNFCSVTPYPEKCKYLK